MGRNYHSTVIKALRGILRPVIWFCLNRSLGLQDLIEQAKIVFIELAAEEMEREGKKINISRISAVTGVHRKDAVRIYRDGNIDETSTKFVSRVIGRWREDKRFLTKNKRPRVLSYKGEKSEFKTLVSLVSTDLRPAAILFDLERVGAVTRTPNGIKLDVAAYVPRNNPEEGFRMLASDTEDLMQAVVENIFCEQEELPNYHAKSVYDNISESDLPKIRAWFLRSCSNFQTRAERFLAKYDLDINPNPKKEGGRRVVLGIFTKT